MSQDTHNQVSQVRAKQYFSAGFTLIEILVTLGVIMILVSLLLPALGRARLTATELSCTARIRELGNLVVAYAAEYDDRFPSALGDGPEITQNRDMWLHYSFQRFSTFPRSPWLEWSGLGPFSEILNCPDYQPWPEGPDRVSDPDYALTSPAFTEIKYWDPDLPESVWKSKLGAKVQRHSAAVYPDRKVGLLEYRVWHGWSGSHCEGCPTEGLWHDSSERPGSLWFLDGHVAQIHGSESLPYLNRYPIWARSPFGTTEWGIAGRDIE
jgi:competence protein ComGC